MFALKTRNILVLLSGRKVKGSCYNCVWSEGHSCTVFHFMLRFVLFHGVYDDHCASPPFLYCCVTLENILLLLQVQSGDKIEGNSHKFWI